MIRIIFLVCMSTAGFIVSHSAAATVAYTITDLGGLGGRSIPYSINASGQITGNSFTAPNHGQSHPFLWTPNVPNGTTGTMVDIAPAGVTSSEAKGLNDNGQVTGTSFSSTATAFYWDGTFHDTGIEGLGEDLNSSGAIVGTLWLANNINHAFVHDSSTHDLGTLGGTYSSAYGINKLGHVTGDSTVLSGDDHAFLYDGAMHDIGSLGGYLSIGVDINDTDQVAGYSYITGSTTVYHAFLFDSVMHDLGSLSGFNSSAQGINNLGQIVGTSSTKSPGITQAFLYTQSLGMVDLNLLIDPSSSWVLTNADAINDFGQIVGVGTHSGQLTAFLLTPVPEPSTATLLLLGILGCVTHRRR